MSYSGKDLTGEIAAAVERRFSRGERISATAVSLEVIAGHVPEFAVGADFACHCAWEATRKAAGAYLVRQFKDADGKIEQLRFPGYQYVQLAYVVSDDDDDVAIPIDELTAKELDKIIGRIEKESQSKAAHARELRSFRVNKFGETLRAA
jgi:hypothetical protein